MIKAPDMLPLAAALTARTQQLCSGLKDGSADLYDLLTPISAELLRWWFLDDICLTRRFNFHPGQKQAILNTIVVTGNYAASSAPTSATRTKASAAGSERTVLSRPVA